MAKIFHPLETLPQEYSEVVSWLTEICRYGKVKDHVTCDHNPDTEAVGFNLYTKEYRYRITCRPFSVMKEEYRNGKKIAAQNSGTYLGATVSTRKPRAGEDWNRGNDLPDGEYSRETWDKIKNAIIAYELVKVHVPKERMYDKQDNWHSTPETPMDSIEDPEGIPNPELNGLPKDKYEVKTDPVKQSGFAYN